MDPLSGIKKLKVDIDNDHYDCLNEIKFCMQIVSSIKSILDEKKEKED